MKVYESNWVRRIAEMKRIDTRRIEELREEVSVRENGWTCGNNGRGTVDEESGCT